MGINGYSSFVIAKNWKEPRCPSTGEWGIQLGNKKGKNHWYMEQSEWVWKGYTLYNSIYVTSLNWQNYRSIMSLKRLHTIWFIYVTFLNWQNYRSSEQSPGCQEFLRKWGWEGNVYVDKKGILQWWNCSIIDCNNGNILVVTLYYSSARSY